MVFTMTVNEYLEKLSGVLGVTVGYLRVVDREIADFGLRRKKRGRNPLQVSHEEAVAILLGVLSTRSPVKAGFKTWQVANLKNDNGVTLLSEVTKLSKELANGKITADVVLKVTEENGATIETSGLNSETFVSDNRNFGHLGNVVRSSWADGNTLRWVGEQF
jgi:hypothetical protein